MAANFFERVMGGGKKAVGWFPASCWDDPPLPPGWGWGVSPWERPWRGARGASCQEAEEGAGGGGGRPVWVMQRMPPAH